MTVVEVVGGVLTGSLALLADAGHLFSDSFAIGLALGAIVLARRPSTPSRSFGFQRAEILAAFVNGLTLVLVSGWIVWEAIDRLDERPDVLGGWMLAVAAIGLAVNALAALILLRSGRESLNVEAAFRHVLADLLGSVGVLVAALVIVLTGWTLVDPLVSLAIAVLIVASAWGVLRDSTAILMEQTPTRIDADAVARAIVDVPGVTSVHDLHVWTITSGFDALSAHVLVGRGEDCHALRRDVERVLAEPSGSPTRRSRSTTTPPTPSWSFAGKARPYSDGADGVSTGSSGCLCRGRLRLRSRSGPRRADLDDRVLRVVAHRVPLVLDPLGALEHLARVLHGEPRLACGLDGARRARRQGEVRDRDRARRDVRVGLPGRRLHPAPELARVEAHGDPGVGRSELHQQRRRPVVAEDELRPAPGDGRLAAHRVARDVELVRLVRDELEAGEEGGVEERRRDLADPAADGVLEPSAVDLGRRDEPVRLGALAERLVEREPRSRLEDRPVEELGGALDVRHTRLAAGVVGRELRDALADSEALPPPRS